MATADITVMGAGIFGLSVAFMCARRGAQVRVIETVGIGAGSSGGLVGALSPHTPENWNPKKQFQLESLLIAEAFWADVESISGLSPDYRRCGRLQALPNERAVELAQQRVTGARDYWGAAAKWEVIATIPGWSPHSETGLFVHDTLSARINPRLACESLAGAIAALGGEVIIGDADAEGQVIWATGLAGLEALGKDLARPVGNGVKGQALTVQFDASDQPQLFADGVHFIPHSNGTVAIGSTSERDYFDPHSTDTQLDALHAKAIALCPVLRDAPIIERWAGVRPRAKTRAPMLGRHPLRKDHFIANGGFKIGFGMAPKVAEVMADLVLDGRDAIPDSFRVEDTFV